MTQKSFRLTKFYGGLHQSKIWRQLDQNSIAKKKKKKLDLFHETLKTPWMNLFLTQLKTQDKTPVRNSKET